MPDYAQLQEDTYERELAHYHAAQEFQAGYSAFNHQSLSAMTTQNMRNGWRAARDATMVSERKLNREENGDILFA